MRSCHLNEAPLIHRWKSMIYLYSVSALKKFVPENALLYLKRSRWGRKTTHLAWNMFLKVNSSGSKNSKKIVSKEQEENIYERSLDTFSILCTLSNCLGFFVVDDDDDNEDATFASKCLARLESNHFLLSWHSTKHRNVILYQEYAVPTYTSISWLFIKTPCSYKFFNSNVYPWNGTREFTRRNPSSASINYCVCTKNTFLMRLSFIFPDDLFNSADEYSTTTEFGESIILFLVLFHRR